MNKLLFTDQQWRDIELHKIVALSGVPGCGKSYIARKLQKRLGACCLSSDMVRLSKVYANEVKYLESSQKYVESRELVYRLLHERMIKRILQGRRVVIDATYLGPQRKALLEVLRREELTAKTIIVVIRADEAVIKGRVMRKKRRLADGREYADGWSQAYYWFKEKLESGEIRYPDEELDGIRVIEIWNQRNKKF
jgi:predicted kinase